MAARKVRIAAVCIRTPRKPGYGCDPAAPSPGSDARASGALTLFFSPKLNKIPGQSPNKKRGRTIRPALLYVGDDPPKGKPGPAAETRSPDDRTRTRRAERKKPLPVPFRFSPIAMRLFFA